MVDDHGVPRKVEILRDHDATRIGSFDRCSRGRAKVGALVATGGLAIGDRQPSEAAGRGTRNRRVEWSTPVALGCQDCECFGHHPGFLFDACELLWRWVCQLGVDLKPSCFELVALDEQRHAGCRRQAARRLSLEHKTHGTRGRLQIDAHETVPFFRRCRGPEADRTSGSLAGELRQVMRGGDRNESDASRLQGTRSIHHGQRQGSLVGRLSQHVAACGNPHHHKQEQDWT